MMNLAAYKTLTQGVIDRFRNVYDVLKQLQRQTRDDGDYAPELRKPLHDLLFDGCRVHKFLEHFSKDNALAQLIRSQKLIDWLEQAHEGVDEFVNKIQRSRFGESFSRFAQITNVKLSEEAWTEAINRDPLDVNDGLMRDRDPATCPLLNIKFFPEDNGRTIWLLGFERQRLRHLRVFNPLFDYVERELGSLTANVIPMPWFIPSDEITVNYKINAGGFGAVFLGMLGFKTQVAVKRMHIKIFDAAALRREISIWYQLNHPHILQFYGATFLDSTCSVVSEFARNGSLDKYLTISGNKKHIWRLLYEAALGLHYMHDMDYVHGDLKCDNILIGDDMKAKVADFGLSFKNGNHRNVDCSATSHWAAPECLDRTRQTERSFPTDVYMLGMCIVEALIGGPPYGGTINAAVRRFVKRGDLPISVLSLAPDVQELVKAMCAFDPADRMKLEDVIATLKQFADANNPDLVRVSGITK